MKSYKRVLALMLAMAMMVCVFAACGSDAASAPAASSAEAAASGDAAAAPAAAGDKVVKIGVNDEFGHSGPAVDLLKEFGLSAENIVKTVKANLNK